MDTIWAVRNPDKLGLVDGLTRVSPPPGPLSAVETVTASVWSTASA
jgi:hypothetical protein